MTDKNKRFADAYNNTAELPSLADVAEFLEISVKRVRNKAGELRAQAAAGDPVPALVSRKRDAEVGRLGFRPVLPGFAVKKTSTQRDADGEVEREWIQTSKAPGDAFEMPKGQILKGVSALVDGSGREVFKWIKTKAEDATDDLIHALKYVFDAYDGHAPLIPGPRFTDDDLLTAYPLADLHHGMHSWGRETGENYDLKISSLRTRSMAGQLISQSRATRYGLVLGLGDLFHMNDQKNMTPRSGHILDVDGRWPKVLATGVRLMMDVIEMALQKHQEVRVRFLPGNHDPDAAIALTVALSVFYAGNPRVIIDDNPSLVFYHRFGQVLLGATHGHTMKPDRMAMMMATDCAEDWGLTKFKHMWFGHIHHETAKEIGPVRVESFNTIAAKDAHAHGGGYRSGQSLNAITFHRELGEVGRHRVNL